MSSTKDGDVRDFSSLSSTMMNRSGEGDNEDNSSKAALSPRNRDHVVDGAANQDRYSRYQKMGLYLFAFCTVSLSSGLVYGWPSVRRQLTQEEQTTLSEKQLGIIFTTGSWSTQSLRCLYGITRDRYSHKFKVGGTRWTAVVGLLCAAGGSLGIAWSSANNVLALTCSFFLVGMGSGTQLCLQPVADLFDSNVQGALLATLSGAFQISGLVFLVLTSGTSHRQSPFSGFALVLLMFAGVGWWILPTLSFTADTKCNHHQTETTDSKEKKYRTSETDPLEVTELGKADNDSCPESSNASSIEMSNSKADDLNENHKKKDSGISSKEANPTQNQYHPNITVWNSLYSAEYILLFVWFTVHLVPLQYYVATIGYQLEQHGDDNGKYTKLFSVVYAAAAIAAPVSGKFTDAYGLGLAQACSTVLSVFSLVLLSVDNISLASHTVGMIAYGIGRMSVFGNYFINVGKRFGYKHYGTLTGLGLFLSGIVSLIQYPMIAVATSSKRSSAAAKVNVGCSILMLCTLPYCGWLAMRERRERRSVQ